MKVNYTTDIIVTLLKNKYRIGEMRFYKGDLSSSDVLIDLERLLEAAKLTDKQSFVLEYYWVQGYTQEEVATMLGVTQQMVEKHSRFVKRKIEKVLIRWKEVSSSDEK